MAPSTPRILQGQQASKQALAEETHTSLGEMEKVYDEEFSTLAAGAKITQSLGVLTTRRVRTKLRRH
ncbi:MAG TPA: DUF3562 domain-containing protein [Steroidobacter sp.]|jgi:hypothetical protein|nr:DUF3562 domain-containing protein [Steroidobacter sp.]